MACINMFNNDQHQVQGPLYNTISPRISFSNDFCDPQNSVVKLENNYREAPVSSDFEFSIINNNMISADKLFSKGKMLPLRENCVKPTTLRDELLAGDDCDYDHGVSPRLTTATSRWIKERLGLKRSVVMPKKSSDKINLEGALERIDEMKTSFDAVFEDVSAKVKGKD